MSGDDIRSTPAWPGRLARRLAPVLLAGLGLVLLVLGPAAVAVIWYDPPAAEPVSYPFRVGEPVPYGPVTFVVHEVRCGPSDEAAQGQLCEVTIGARNEGRAEVTVPSHAQSLHVSQGARHLPVADGTGELGTLAPGEARTAVVRFDLPIGVTLTHLELRAGTYQRGVPVGVDTPYPLLGGD